MKINPIKTLFLGITTGAIAISSHLFSPSEALAVQFQFTKIADTDTLIPNKTSKFDSFYYRPLIDNGTVYFQGFNISYNTDFEIPIPSYNYGIYAHNGNALTTAVETGSLLNSETGNFQISYVNDFSVSGNNIAFLGSAIDDNTVDYKYGIFSQVNNSIKSIVDSNNFMSEQSDNWSFPYFNNLALSGENIAFTNTQFNLTGLPKISIYAQIGDSLTTIADSNTFIPGTSSKFDPLSLDQLDISGETVVFRGNSFDDNSGIYAKTGEELTTIVDTRNAVSIDTESINFRSVSSPSISDENIAFYGDYINDKTDLTQGIYAKLGESFVKIADTDTLIPETTDNFNDFSVYNSSFPTIAISGENIAFTGGNTLSSSEGIYAYFNKTLTKVIARYDSLDGKILDGDNFATFNFGQQGLSGNSLVFVATFSDGSRGIYRADAVPEPLTVLGTGVAIAFGIYFKKQGTKK